MSNRLEQIINLKLNNFEIKYPKKKESYIEPNPCGEPGYVAYGTKIKDGVEVPNCIPDPEEMKKIIKEGFPIPSPENNESKDVYIARCNAAISDEYGYEKANAICYSKWDDK
jgi:hypothetical protein